MSQVILNNSIKYDDVLNHRNRKDSQKSDNNNNNSNLSINHDLLNLNQDNNLLSENINNVSYNEINNLNSQLIKKLNNNNFYFNQFNLDEINNTNDNFLQNNLSIRKDLRNLDYFNILDTDNENIDLENFKDNIHIGNVDEIDNLNDRSYEMKNRIKTKNLRIGDNFENPDNKFFDFVLSQVKKKNLDKKTKKNKNKKIDSLLNDVTSNLANSRLSFKEEEYNSNSLLNNSLNIHFKNENSNQQRKILREEKINQNNVFFN